MKKILKVIVVSLILVFSLIIVNPRRNVKADSGWDTSYDSGSSYDSSSSRSSRDYSSRYDSSSSSGEYSPIIYIIGYVIVMGLVLLLLYIILNEMCEYKNYKTVLLVVFITFIILPFIIGAKIAGNIVGILLYLILIIFLILPKKKKTNNYKEINEEILNKYIDKSLFEIKEELFNKFVDIQNGWMNFDYDVLRKLCDNNIYNTYYEELEALKIKDGQNVMSDFRKLDDKITNITEKKDLIIIEYYLDVKFYDYVINTKTNKIIKGNNKNKVHNKYILKFVKSNKTIDFCPNCGSKIESGTTKCTNCKAVIVQDSNEFVMTEKRKIN